LTELSELSPRKRAARYRELAREARVHAANSKADKREAFVKLAGKWEQLALEADSETEAKTDEGSDS
jgi:hypothetical protein